MKGKKVSIKKTDRIRIRKFWSIDPRERIHGEGKKGRAYDRNREKRGWTHEQDPD